MAEVRTYYIQNYKVSDDKKDRIIARGEVKIKTKDGEFRGLTFDEWAKFAEIKSLHSKYKFLLINKDKLTGKVILEILDKAPYMLNKIVEEMGGVGYAMLELEGYLFKISPARIKQAKARLRVWEREFDSFYSKLKSISFNKKLELLLYYLFHADAAGTIYGLLPKEQQAKIPFDKKKFYEAMRDEKKSRECMQKLRDISDKLLVHLKANPRIVEALIDSIAIGFFLFKVKGIKYSFEKHLTDGLLDLQTDCDRYASIYVHFAKRKGWDVSIFSLNNHTTVTFNNGLFPGGRIFIESTDGLVVDVDLYKRKLPIPCLRMGFPDSTFIKSPEKIVTSVITQKINGLLGKIEGREKVSDEDKRAIERYMLLANKLIPNDPSKLVLSQMVFGALGDRKKAESYRQKLIQLLKK